MRYHRLSGIAVMTMAALCAAIGAAHADLKLEQTTTVKGQEITPGATQKASTSTTKTVMYYKGVKQRTESGNSVSIYDGTTDKIYLLDTKTKTYSVTSTADIMTQGGANPMADMVDFDGKADVTDTGEEKLVAGKTAHHYRYTLTITLSVKKDGPAAIAAMLPSFTLSGDQWTVVTADSEAVNKTRATGMLSQLPPGMGKGLKPLMEKMSTIKGIPLESVQTMKITPNPSAPEEMKAQFPTEPLVSDTKTLTVSETDLDDALFAVPADYKKIEAPKTPIIPGA